MKLMRAMVLIIGLFALHMNPLSACESYEPYTMDEIKTFRDMLQKADADPFDRLYAFEQLACSDRPNVRQFALKSGMSNTKDSLIRNEIMLKAMMQKGRIDIELGDARTLTDSDKEFIQRNGGVYTHQVTFRSPTEGCLSLYGDQCRSGYSVWIKGDKVEFDYSPVSGEFRLSGANELVGTLRAANKKDYTRIPAVIKLF